MELNVIVYVCVCVCVVRCSVTSIKSGSEKLHRRGSSLGNQQELFSLQNDTKLRMLNCSSPDFDANGQPQQGSDRMADQTNRENHAEVLHLSPEASLKKSRVLSNSVQRSDSESKQEDGEEQDAKEKGDSVFIENATITDMDEVTTPSHKTSPSRPYSERSVSLNSADEGSLAALNSSREDRASTMLSDMSGSCSTLQNERQDGEMESSTEQSKQRLQQQISVSFRQELLNVSQVKTESRIGVEVTKLTESNFNLVQLLGRSLPHIVPIVPLTKREVRWAGLDINMHYLIDEQ